MNGRRQATDESSFFFPLLLQHNVDAMTGRKCKAVQYACDKHVDETRRKAKMQGTRDAIITSGLQQMLNQAEAGEFCAARENLRALRRDDLPPLMKAHIRRDRPFPGVVDVPGYHPDHAAAKTVFGMLADIDAALKAKNSATAAGLIREAIEAWK